VGDGDNKVNLDDHGSDVEEKSGEMIGHEEEDDENLEDIMPDVHQLGRVPDIQKHYFAK